MRRKTFSTLFTGAGRMNRREFLVKGVLRLVGLGLLGGVALVLLLALANAYSENEVPEPIPEVVSGQRLATDDELIGEQADLILTDGEAGMLFSIWGPVLIVGYIAAVALAGHGIEDLTKGRRIGVAVWVFGCCVVTGAIFGWGSQTAMGVIYAVLLPFVFLICRRLYREKLDIEQEV